MKKILFASVMAAAISAPAFSQVTLYGKVDTGYTYLNVDTGRPSASRQTRFKMDSGQSAGSRWGIEGWEDLGSGYRVGFKLESGFNLDTGASAQGGRLFGRESILRVQGPFGTLKFGRMGALASGYPDTGLFGGNMSPFAVGFGDIPGHRFIFAGDFSCLDNAITYNTPSFNGWTLMLQYSHDRNSQDKSYAGEHGIEGKSSVDRSYGAAVQFKNLTTEFNFVVDSTNYASHLGPQLTKHQKDSFVMTAGIRHSISWARLFAAAQYFTHARDFLQEAYQLYGTQDKFMTNKLGKNGFGGTLGIEIPSGPGYWKFAVGYMDAKESENHSQKFKRMQAALGYWWTISKRTALYVDAGYVHDKLTSDAFKDYGKANAYTGNIGLVHNF